MAIDIPTSTVSRLKFDIAVAQESSLRVKELPSDVIEFAIGPHVDEFAAQLEGEARKGIDVVPQEIVWSSKGVLRFRPISAMMFRDQCLYRALVNDATSDAEDSEPPFEQHAEFERAILAEGSPRFVAVADVTAFYQYVDHELVEQRIVDSTGRWDTASLVRAFLGVVYGRGFGLPQGPHASDVLAELVLAPIERKLRRDGYRVVRYSDDFRFGLETRGAANEALETLATELASIGLTLNEEKCRVLYRDTYSRRVGEIQKQVEDALTEVHLRPRMIDMYGTRVASIPTPKKRNLKAIQTFEAAVEAVANPFAPGSTQTTRTVNRRLAQIGLPRLANWKVKTPLDWIPTISSVDPSLARSIGRYLRALARETKAYSEISAALDATIKRIGRHGPEWQQAWLMEPLLSREVGLSDGLTTWLTDFVASAKCDVLRARALQVMAIHGLISTDRLTKVFNRISPIARPDIVAAAAIAGTLEEQALLTSITQDSALYAWVAEKVQASTDLLWL